MCKSGFKDNNVLLITRYPLCYKYFEDSYGVDENGNNWDKYDSIIKNEEYIKISDHYEIIKTIKASNIQWDNCSLRKWLNNEFVDKSFSSSELAYINNTIVTTQNVPITRDHFGTHILSGGSNTYDKLFLLSAEEYDIYQSKLEPVGKWWLRSPGVYCFTSRQFSPIISSGVYYDHIDIVEAYIQCIGSEGIEESEKYETDDYLTEEWCNYQLGNWIVNQSGVRPAMWVHIGG